MTAAVISAAFREHLVSRGPRRSEMVVRARSRVTFRWARDRALVSGSAGQRRARVPWIGGGETRAISLGICAVRAVTCADLRGVLSARTVRDCSSPELMARWSGASNCRPSADRHGIFRVAMRRVSVLRRHRSPTLAVDRCCCCHRCLSRSRGTTNLAVAGAGMRARSYHASPGEITSVGGCAQHSSMNCASTPDGGAVPGDVPQETLAAPPPVTRTDAVGWLGCEKIRKGSRPYRRQIVIHT